MVRLQPERLLQTLAGLGALRVLRAAVELGVFSELGQGPRSCEQLCRRLGLHRQLAPTLLDTLLGLGWLEREGDDDQAIYMNSREAGQFLDARQPAFLGSLLAHAEAGWLRPPQGLAAALRQPGQLREFEAQVSMAIGQAHCHGLALAERVDLAPWTRLLVLAATHDSAAALMAPVLADHPHLDGSSATLTDDEAAWPEVDVLVLHVVGDGLVAQRLTLLQRAAAALAPEGRLIVIDHLLDDARRRSTPALLQALARQVEGRLDPPLTVQAARQLGSRVGLSDEQCLPLGGGASALMLRR